MIICAVCFAIPVEWQHVYILISQRILRQLFLRLVSETGKTQLAASESMNPLAVIVKLH